MTKGSSRLAGKACLVTGGAHAYVLIANAAAKASAPGEAVGADFAPRIPMGKVQKPEDVANIVLFLACDESAQIIGTQMVVDGGMQLSH